MIPNLTTLKKIGILERILEIFVTWEASNPEIL
jgi:hypothetical protein